MSNNDKWECILIVSYSFTIVSLLYYALGLKRERTIFLQRMELFIIYGNDSIKLYTYHSHLCKNIFSVVMIIISIWVTIIIANSYQIWVINS